MQKGPREQRSKSRGDFKNPHRRTDGKPRGDRKGFKKPDRPVKKALRKPKKQEDYKSTVILNLLKILKKMKAFGIRKYLRAAKMAAEGDEHYKGKETPEELERTAELFKEVKNPEVKVMIPLLISVELKDDLHKYWPVLEQQVLSSYLESCDQGCVQRLTEKVFG